MSPSPPPLPRARSNPPQKKTVFHPIVLLGTIIHLCLYLFAIRRRSVNFANMPGVHLSNPSGVHPASSSMVEDASFFEPPDSRRLDGGEARSSTDEVAIETVLIVAAAPINYFHTFSLWSILECVTSGIDRVLISAPDTAWSRDNVAAIIAHFKNQSRILNATMTFELEGAFYTNDRYDTGLWCDALNGMAYDGRRFLPLQPGNNGASSAATPRAVFLINDSAGVFKPYRSLTEKVARASQIEQDPNRVGSWGKSLKFVGLHADFTAWGWSHYWWVESVYRGFTPDGLATFFNHTCNRPWACRGTVGNGKKKCIVNTYEKDLVNAFDRNESAGLWPSYPPKAWDIDTWEAMNGNIKGREQWIEGKKYFEYLQDMHDFPFRKAKKGKLQIYIQGKGECISRLGGDDKFLHSAWQRVLHGR